MASGLTIKLTVNVKISSAVTIVWSDGFDVWRR